MLIMAVAVADVVVRVFVVRDFLRQLKSLQGSTI